MAIPVRKHKGNDWYDWYACTECGKKWKSYFKKIGHNKCQ